MTLRGRNRLCMHWSARWWNSRASVGVVAAGGAWTGLRGSGGGPRGRGIRPGRWTAVRALQGALISALPTNGPRESALAAVSATKEAVESTVGKINAELEGVGLRFVLLTARKPC